MTFCSYISSNLHVGHFICQTLSDKLLLQCRRHEDYSCTCAMAVTCMQPRREIVRLILNMYHSA